jgi:PAS domain S-box-containing protein
LNAEAPGDDAVPFSGTTDLRDAQALLRIAASMGRLGAWSVELDTLELHWSDEVRAIHQVPRGFTCTVERAVEFYAPWARPMVAEAFRQCVEQGRPYDLELQLVTARDEWIWVRAMGQAERDAAGRITRVRGAFQDITQSKQAAERSRELADRLTMTLESLTDGFFTLDRKWRFTYLNPPAERMLERSRHELVSRSIWQMFPQAVGSRFHREYQRAIQTDQAVEFEEHYEPLGVWVQVRAFPSPQGLAVSFRNVTAQVRAQQEILRLTVELEERVQERTAELHATSRDLEALSYALAHDLRAPLSAVCGFAQRIAETEGSALSPRGQHYLSRVLAAGRHMDAMTEGLLGFARLSKAPFAPVDLDLAQIARNVATLLENAVEERPVEFIVPASLPAFGDKVLLTQLMQNLLSNAWKFSGRSEHPRVELLSLVTPEGCTAYCISDNGVGFDMAQASRLFGSFERLHSQEEFPGTGIGLALVRKVVERHKGRAWAESAPGCGARIYFTLCADRPRHSDGGANASRPCSRLAC